ncbi:hypothetical protein AX15_001926 [Amanita polypyramis BW_CC]|nr:hypothetical protein AX15_001926 [Amanita polypyramis BW_CC]
MVTENNTKSSEPSPPPPPPPTIHGKVTHKIDWDALRTQSLQPGGFGADRRQDIWPKLLNVAVPAASGDSDPGSGSYRDVDDDDYPNWTGEYDKDEDIGDDPRGVADTNKPTDVHKDEYQIRLDTDRSFVLYPDDSKTHIPRPKLQSDLNQLIVSIFRNRPKLNYFQGYHDVMTVVYLTLPSELQFACAEKLSLHRLRDSMLHSLEPVLGLLRVLKNLLRLADPEFAKLLEQDSPLPFYALSNLLTLFSHDMPTLPLIQHVFDYLLCRPPIAVVYLAAAMLLARKDYIQSVEDQVEPFMLHPILSSLPPLTEGFESTEQKPPDDQSLLKSEDTSLLSSLDDVKQEPCNEPPPVCSSDDNIKIELSSLDVVVKQELPDYSSVLDENGPLRPLAPDAIRPPPPGPDPMRLADLPPRQPSPPIKAKPDHEPEPTSSPSPSLDTGLPLPATPPIPLPTILSHADSIYTQYPPSHPLLRLSSIMGPQSVMFTWSETFADLPSDTMAEAMIGKPELVVYPVSPEEMEGSEEEGGSGGEGSETDSGSEYDERRRGKRVGSHKRRKTRKEGGKDGVVWGRMRRKTIRKKIRKLLNVFGTGPSGAQITHVDGRTMVAGAVLVLGVAMAVYGIKAHGGSGVLSGASVEESIGVGLGAGLNMLGDRLSGGGNRHGHVHDELKKVASVLVDVGTKFLNLGDGVQGGRR